MFDAGLNIIWELTVLENNTEESKQDLKDSEEAFTAVEQSVHTDENIAGQNAEEEFGGQQKLTKKQQFVQFIKFTLFSASAGIIQLLTTTLLHQWTGWLIDYYWLAYVIGLTLSVIWNFTFNRKFTFKAANNVPLAMFLVLIYNCIIVVPLAVGGNALENLWGPDLGIVVTVITLLINFITEYLWDKFIVFNQKVTDKILNRFKRKK